MKGESHFEWSVAGLRAEVILLRELLRPVAALEPVFNGRPDGARVVSTWKGDITVADVRAAAKALTREPV